MMTETIEEQREEERKQRMQMKLPGQEDPEQQVLDIEDFDVQVDMEAETVSYLREGVSPVRNDIIGKVGDKIVNGIDISHWQGAWKPAQLPPWVQFFGMKACHSNGPRMQNGVDPRWKENREKVHTEVNHRIPFIGHYIYLVHDVPMLEQIELLADTVGALHVGECVYLDWEDRELEVLDEEAMWHLNCIYGGRVMVYINDVTPGMTSFMQMMKETHVYPLMHPNYGSNDWRISEIWDATILQRGWGKVPGFNGDVPVDIVTWPDFLSHVCGYHHEH